MGFRLGFGGGCAPCCGGGGTVPDCGVVWGAAKCFVEVIADNVVADFRPAATVDPSGILRKILAWGGGTYAGKFELTKVFSGYDVFARRFVERWEYEYPQSTTFDGIFAGATLCFSNKAKITVEATRENVSGNPGGKCGISASAAFPAWRFDSVVGMPSAFSYACSDFGCTSMQAAAGVLSSEHVVRFLLAAIEEVSPKWTNDMLLADSRFHVLPDGRLYTGGNTNPRLVSSTTPPEVQSAICTGFNPIFARPTVSGNDAPRMHISFQ